MPPARFLTNCIKLYQRTLVRALQTLINNVNSGGTCVTLQRGTDVQILEQEQWRKGGSLTATFKFNKYEHRLVRRAGIINDYSFFEIQLQATSSSGIQSIFFSNRVLP